MNRHRSIIVLFAALTLPLSAAWQSERSLSSPDGALVFLLERDDATGAFAWSAIATLQALTSTPYFSEGDDKAGLLVYAARNYSPDPDSHLTNTSLIWGDYYLLEALVCYQKLELASSK